MIIAVREGDARQRHAEQRFKARRFLETALDLKNDTLSDSPDALAEQLCDGLVLCGLARYVIFDILEEEEDAEENSGFPVLPENLLVQGERNFKQSLEYIKWFFEMCDRIQVPELDRFSKSDLVQGRVDAIVKCILSVKNNVSARMLVMTMNESFNHLGEDDESNESISSDEKENDIDFSSSGQYMQPQQMTSTDLFSPQKVFGTIKTMASQVVDATSLFKSTANDVENVKTAVQNNRNNAGLFSLLTYDGPGMGGPVLTSGSKALPRTHDTDPDMNFSVLSALEMVQEQVTHREEAKRTEQLELTKAEKENLEFRVKALELEQKQANHRAEKEASKRSLHSSEMRKKCHAVSRCCSDIKDACADLSDTVKQNNLQLAEDFRSFGSQLVHKLSSLAFERDQAKNLYEKEESRRRKLYEELQEMRGNIRVFCRVRPMGVCQKHGLLQDGEENPFAMHNTVSLHNNFEVIIKDPKIQKEASRGGRQKQSKVMPKAFEFDRVFGPKSTQEDVFDEVAPMVAKAMDGKHVCIFAYGQTGSGKTYTMEGTEENHGVNIRAIQQLFNIRAERKHTHTYAIQVSMVEIYNETVRDLLSKEQHPPVLDIRQGRGDTGIHLPGVTKQEAASAVDVRKIIAYGHSKRAVGATNANLHSSRSHSLVMIDLVGSPMGGHGRVKGRIVLVDLAGSERVSKTSAMGERLKEAKNINKSLSALGNVISALAQKREHVPYRDSKLTFLLQSSLEREGNKALMIAQISPELDDVGESKCTLTFAARVKKVELGNDQTGSGTNEILRLENEMCELKQKLAGRVHDMKKIKTELSAVETGKKSHARKVKDLQVQRQMLLDQREQMEKKMRKVLEDAKQASVQSSISIRNVEEENERLKQQMSEMQKQHREEIDRIKRTSVIEAFGEIAANDENSPLPTTNIDKKVRRSSSKSTLRLSHSKRLLMSPIENRKLFVSTKAKVESTRKAKKSSTDSRRPNTSHGLKAKLQRFKNKKRNVSAKAKPTSKQKRWN